MIEAKGTSDGGGRRPKSAALRPLTEAESRLAADPGTLSAALRFARKRAIQWGIDPDTLASDVAARIIRCARRYRDGEMPWKAYVMRGVVMETMDAARRRNAAGFRGAPRAGRDRPLAVKSIERLVREEIPAADDAGGGRDADDAAAEILSSLKPRSESVVRAIVLDGYTKAEVAKRLGITPTHVNNIYTAAIDHLRVRLGKDTGRPC